jgi:hypothetical protein
MGLPQQSPSPLNGTSYPGAARVSTELTSSADTHFPQRP